MVTDFYNDFRIIYQTEKCIACDSIVVGSSSFSFKVWTDDFSRKISIYECGFCGLAYSYPFLSGAEEKKLYKDYPSHHTHEDVLENKIDLFQKVKVFFENHIAKTFFCSRKPWIRKILSCFLFQRMFQGYPIFFKNEENPKVLDIGCGDGYFLGIAQKFGYFCYGTEFHHGIVRKLEKRKIIAKKYLGDFINNEQFDVIRMSHVLEHLKEPNQALQDIRQLLKNDGELIICVPNFDNISKRFKEYYSLHLPYHRHHYTKQSLIAMLKKHEFTVDYYKTKSIGIFSTSFARKYKKFRLPLVLKTFDIFLSIIMDIFNYGDSIEIYARKIN